jgi:hypothetical protein
VTDADQAKLAKLFDAIEADRIILANLVIALLNANPDRGRIVEAMRVQTERYCDEAPPGTEVEFLVEIRARLQVMLRGLGASGF